MTERTEPGGAAPMRAAVRKGALSLLGVTAVSLVLWGVVSGVPGLWGAGIGAAMGGVFVLITAIVVLATAGQTPATTGAAVLGSWLLKIVVAIGVMVVLRSMTFYDRPALVMTLVLAMVVVLAAETRAVLTTRVPYVDPEPSTRH